jgi:hypothetical protein
MEKMESIVGGVGIGGTDAVVTSMRRNPRESVRNWGLEKLLVAGRKVGKEDGARRCMKNKMDSRSRKNSEERFGLDRREK